MQLIKFIRSCAPYREGETAGWPEGHPALDFYVTKMQVAVPVGEDAPTAPTPDAPVVVKKRRGRPPSRTTKLPRRSRTTTTVVPQSVDVSVEDLATG